MASYNLRDRVERSSVKEREHVETQALQQFHGIVSKVGESQLEIGQLMVCVRTTTISQVSSRINIKAKQLEMN